LQSSVYFIELSLSRSIRVINQSSVSTLIIALRTGDRRAHTLVVDDLVKFGPAAVEPLILALDDPNPGVRTGAARALGKIGDGRALGALIFRLRYDVSAEVRKSAVWALHMGENHAITALIEALCDKDEWVRFGAVIVLSKIGESSIEPLIEALQDPHPLVRANAAETLGRIGDKRAAEGLAKTLSGDEAYVWYQAAIALGRLSDARAVHYLIQIIGDAKSDLRTKAIKALGQIGDVRAVDTLLDVLYHEADRWMRLFAIEALGRIGDIRAIEALVDMVYDESRDLRTKAIVTLGEFDYTLALDALDYLAHDPELEAQDQQTALFELGKRGDLRALKGLVHLLREDIHADTRMYITLILSDLGRAEAVESLLDALDDPVSDVVTHAMKALVKMGDVTTNALSNLLCEFSNVDRRLRVIRVLGEIATPRAIRILTQVALDSAEEWWVREEVRDTLRRLGYDPHTPT
jgi:HEAT repeat protein